MTPGDALRAWREAKDLSQSQAADLISVNQSIWAAWETGRKRPSLTNALALEELDPRGLPTSMWARARASLEDASTPPARKRRPAFSAGAARSGSRSARGRTIGGAS